MTASLDDEVVELRRANAELRQRLDEGLAREAATAEVLQVINSSPGDLVPVFDAILERAMRLCDAAYGQLHTFDGERFHPTAMRGEPRVVEWWRQVGPFQPAEGSSGPLARILRQRERLVCYADATQEETYHQVPGFRELVDIGGIRSLACVALTKEETLFGTIGVYRREVRPFTDKQIALLQNFAAQAVIAMENARLLTETREALEQQTATAEVLQVINSSPGDLAPVFDAMLDKALTLCDAAFGVLWTFNGESFRAAALHRVPAAFADLLANAPYRREPGSIGERLMCGEPFVQVRDAAEEVWVGPGRQALIEQGGARSLIAVPLRKDGAVLGVISAYRQEVRPFTDKQIALLQNFAAQAVIAMENARLLTETRVALEQQTATAEVLQVINSSPGDLAPVFDAMLEKATRLCQAPFGVLRTWDGAHFHVAAVHGDASFTEWAWNYGPFAPAYDSPLGRIVSGEEDIARFADAPGEEAHSSFPDFRAFVDASGMRSGITVALRKDSTLVGAVTVYRQEVRPFTDKQIALLQNFAAQAVIAMENARLLTETREALEQQTATAEVLRVINSSPGDLAPVFEAILEKAHALCGAEVGTLAAYDGEYFHALATFGYSEQFAEFVRRPFRPNVSMQRLIEGERVLHLPDQRTLESEPPDAETTRAFLDLTDLRTTLFVALRKDTSLLGYVSAHRHGVRPFSEKEIALLENFAAQAVIAMENARLLTETREALEQQTATAEVLQVINSSPGNLAPVFNAMLDKALRLCEAAIGYLLTYDGERFQRVAERGLPEPYLEYVRAQATQPAPGGGQFRLLGGEPFVQFADMKDDEAYRSGANPGHRAMVDLAGARTGLVVPLRKDSALLGTITIFRQEVRLFDDKQIALLQNFAAQAVIAMENARLLSETREALEQQTATAEVLQVINSSPGDLAPVFDAMLEKALRLCEAPFGLLRTWDGERFHLAAASGDVKFMQLAWNYGPWAPAHKSSPAGRIVRGEDIVRFADAPGYEAISTSPGFSALVEASGMRSGVVVALRKDNALLGVIVVYRQEVRPFTDKQVALLQNFAAQAVIAIENARLLGETREALEQQTATAEVLQVINSSPGDLKPVFDAMLDKAHTLCEAASGSLIIIDGEEFRAVAVRGQSEEFADRLRQGLPISSGPLMKRIREGEPVVHIHDLAELDDSEAQVAFEQSGNRTVLAVPLRKDKNLLGMIVADRREVRPFTDKQIALLQNFAAQAVIAMENARLLTETREALEQQTATAEVLGVINSSPGDLAPVFDAMLQRAVLLCEFDLSTLWTFEGSEFHGVAKHGMSDRFWSFIKDRTPPSFARLAAGERLVNIPDLRQIPQYMESDLARQVRNLGLEAEVPRSQLLLALRKDDVLLGAIVAYRLEVRPFTDKQIALLENFAAQAVIAMENARLLTETREALEQQTATAEVLQVINSSPGDLAPVFDAMLDKAMRLCEADYGHVLTFDGQLFHAGAIRGEAEFVEWRRRLGPIRPDSGADASPLGRVLQGEHVAQVIDATQEKAYRAHPPYKVLVDISGIRSQAAVALRKEDVLFGAIVVYRREVRAYTEKQIALLQNFAAQAVIAMENARLLGELHQRTEEVAELNRGLEARVAEQVDELGRVGRLKRFLAPQLAELIVSQGDEKILESHRREIVVVFCDLRGYTAFTETAEPEEVLAFLREYHGALGPLVSQFEGTLDQFSGDGIMVFFNDPVPIPDPAERAVKMAMAMREEAGKLIAAWRRHGCELGFGAGIAQGFATLGQIGFSDRSGYTAIGTVCNLAARLCAEAKDGQILVSSRIAEAVEAVATLEDLGNLELKGLRRPVAAFNVSDLISGAPAPV